LAEVSAAHPELGRSALRARVLAGAGALAHDQSDYAAATALLEASVALWRELTGPDQGMEQSLAHALNCLANVRFDQNEPERARALYEEALELYRRAEDRRGAAMVLSNLGALHLEQGEVDRAAALLQESIRLKRQLGNPYGLAMSLESLGNLERSRGNRERALALCGEALALRRGLGHRMGIAMSLNNLGHLLLEAGDPEEARRHLLESLDLFLELDEPRSVIESLTGLAGTMAATGRCEDAARLLAAIDAQREGSGFEPRPCEKVVLKHWRGAVREALDEERLERVSREGAVLILGEAVSLARS
jgi:tetratricopeptide (TPR) repeat protein